MNESYKVVVEDGMVFVCNLTDQKLQLRLYGENEEKGLKGPFGEWRLILEPHEKRAMCEIVIK